MLRRLSRVPSPPDETADLRRFRFHDLRHTFGSLLIQEGASIVYVKEQMGHSSTQIVVDAYSCLIPGANVNCVGAQSSARLVGIRESSYSSAA